MFANRYTALVDACTLARVWHRNLLLSLAEAEFFRVRWSSPILDETHRALLKMHREKRSEDPDERATRSINAMRRAFPEAEVEGFEALLPSCSGLPDQNDRHVLAAAIATQAQAIVTENLRDFPAAILAGFNLEVRSADQFIADTMALDEGRAISAVRRMRARLRKPEMGAEEFLRALEANGLVEAASLLGPHADSI